MSNDQTSRPDDEVSEPASPLVEAAANDDADVATPPAPKRATRSRATAGTATTSGAKKASTALSSAEPAVTPEPDATAAPEADAQEAPATPSRTRATTSRAGAATGSTGTGRSTATKSAATKTAATKTATTKKPAAKAAPADAGDETPVEAPAPVAEAPTADAPTAEAPASAPAEPPAPAVEAPAPVAEAPAEAPAPAPAAEAPSASAPVSRTATTRAPVEAEPLPAPTPERVVPQTGRRVVVAEDEALIRLDVVETLTEAGFHVVGEAGDGETAVALATQLKPDVVVMDIKMPILDGISAASRIGKARVAPVVLLTAFSQAELVERARDAGAMAYVVKPFTPAELLPAIEIAIARHAEITALESEVADLAERFETRKRVERAKGLLMTKMGLTEPESFRWIQKTSMDRRLTMREVADAVIEQVGSGEKAR